jgi:hypothetical protein
MCGFANAFILLVFCYFCFFQVYNHRMNFIIKPLLKHFKRSFLRPYIFVGVPVVEFVLKYFIKIAF